MRFLADENVERPIVEAVRALGHDVAYVSEMSRGVDDEWLLKLANQEQYVLITNDKDFGELVYLRGQAAAGILLLRFRVEKSSVKAALVNVFFAGSRCSSGRSFRGVERVWGAHTPVAVTVE